MRKLKQTGNGLQISLFSKMHLCQWEFNYGFANEQSRSRVNTVYLFSCILLAVLCTFIASINLYYQTTRYVARYAGFKRNPFRKRKKLRHKGGIPDHLETIPSRLPTFLSHGTLQTGLSENLTFAFITRIAYDATIWIDWIFHRSDIDAETRIARIQRTRRTWNRGNNK